MTEDEARSASEGADHGSADHAVLESDVREALRQVVDPEIRIDVVTLGLIRDVAFNGAETEITMILTTPFCPYGGYLIQQVRDVATAAVGGQVRVTMGEEQWSPAMMEGADLAEWGLI